jgi:predicted DNA-binding protein (MmcQ/YjbR family)
MAARKAPTNRAEAALRDFGLALPETTEDFPWDHRALKVRGKVFVFFSTESDGSSKGALFKLSCKLPSSAPMALMLAGVEPTGYGLGKAGWVSGCFSPSKVPVAMLKDWILESYRAVAPKKVAALLDLDEPAAEPKKAKSRAKKRRSR